MMALAFVRVNDGVFANEGNGIGLAAVDDSATQPFAKPRTGTNIQFPASL